MYLPRLRCASRLIAPLSLPKFVALQMKMAPKSHAFHPSVASAEATIPAAWDDRLGSDLGSLSKYERVLHIDAEISDGVLDLRVAEQDLDGAQVTRRPIDH